MSTFTACSAQTGQVLFMGTADAPQDLANTSIVVIEQIAPDAHYWHNSTWVEIPEKPSEDYFWNWTTHSWET